MPDRPSVPGAPFLPGDRATAPMVLEENSASAWQRFEELQRSHEAGVPAPPIDAAPAPQGGDGYARTVPMPLAEARAPTVAQAPQAAQPVTLDEAMLLARRNNRACPIPPQWAAFHALLPARKMDGGRSMPPPVPVDGPAWGATSAMQKRLRLRDQIEWADRAGVLPAAFAFLAALPEEQWHHFGE